MDRLGGENRALSRHERQAYVMWQYWHQRNNVATLKAVIMPSDDNIFRAAHTELLEHLALQSYFDVASIS